MAQTATGTTTYARIHLLTMQLKVALRRLTDLRTDPKYLELLMKGVEWKWLQRFTVDALDSAGLCRAELVLDIDWLEHDRMISIGRATVTVDDNKWIDSTCIEVTTAIETFEEFVAQRGLHTRWTASYTGTVWNDKALRAKADNVLHLQPVEPAVWKSEPFSAQLRPNELPELTIIVSDTNE